MNDEPDKQVDEAAAAGDQAKPKRRRRRAKASDGEAAAAPKRRRARPKADDPEAQEPKVQEQADDAADAPPEKEAEPKPARRRQAPEPGAPPAVVHARAKYVRTSARKARLLSDHIRGKSVEEARAILRFAPRAVARDWGKLLESAVANAEHNHELVGDELRIKEVYADEGPTLKRYRPRAMGRATRIRKRTTHLTITLTPKETI